MQHSQAPASVIINACNNMEAIRRVLVTPLSSSPSSVANQAAVKSRGSQIRQQFIVDKLLLKAFCRTSKKEWKMFTLRNVDTASIKSCDDLKEEIRIQFSDDIRRNFDVGYVQGSNLISVRSSHDVCEVWNSKRKGYELTLWCDGLKEGTSCKSRKRKHNEVESDYSSDEEKHQKKRKKSKREEREEKVEESVTLLKEKHGKNFTAMQYRIWGEMIGGDLHSSLETPPNTSMFIRAGGNTPSRRKSDNSVAQALTIIADQFSPSVSQSKPTGGSATSPAKMIENRSKCYRQLKELHDLKSTGVLTEAEYEAEKKSVVQTLKNL